ncbi:MAG: rRNA pseudouridine synthase [Holosporales bacterium]|jgi:23S rRNA pseudouridine2605 synthase|nr:rRNA pseudouridine synthase [Holosporales bacterium]
MMRLNRAIALLGICSRREADKLIASKGVLVNNEKVMEIGMKVSENTLITVGEKNYFFKMAKEAKVWIYYKPAGLITTHSDEKNRKTIFDDIKTKIDERVISVGRLDLNSEGLLLLTTDSRFSRLAEFPKNSWKRYYKVRVFGQIDMSMKEKLEQGITINGTRYAPIMIEFLKKTSGKNCWLNCVLTEGKNREIRKIFASFGLLVNKLIRYKYGPYELKDLKPGEIRLIEIKKIQS